MVCLLGVNPWGFLWAYLGIPGHLWGGWLTEKGHAMAIVYNGLEPWMVVRHDQGVFDDQTANAVPDEKQRPCLLAYKSVWYAQEKVSARSTHPSLTHVVHLLQQVLRQGLQRHAIRQRAMAVEKDAGDTGHAAQPPRDPRVRPAK